MNGVNLLWRRTETMGNHCRHQRRNLLCRSLLSEVEFPFVPEHFAENHDRVHVRQLHLFRLVAGEETHLGG